MSRGLHRLSRRHWSPAAVQSPAPVVGEHHAVGVVGIAGYTQMAEIVQPMMPAALCRPPDYADRGSSWRREGVLAEDLVGIILGC